MKRIHSDNVPLGLPFRRGQSPPRFGGGSEYLLATNLFNTAFSLLTLLLVTRGMDAEEQRQILLFLSVQGLAIISLVSPWELIGSRLRSTRHQRSDTLFRAQWIVGAVVTIAPIQIITLLAQIDIEEAFGFASVGAATAASHFARARLVAERQYRSLAIASLVQAFPMGFAVLIALQATPTKGSFFIANIVGNVCFSFVATRTPRGHFEVIERIAADDHSLSSDKMKSASQMLLGMAGVTAAQYGMVQLPLWLGDLQSQEPYSLATIALATSTAMAVTGFCMAPTLASLVAYLQVSEDSKEGSRHSVVLQFVRLTFVSAPLSTVVAQASITVVLGASLTLKHFVLCAVVSLISGLSSTLSLVKSWFLRSELEPRSILLTFLPLVLGLGVGAVTGLVLGVFVSSLCSVYVLWFALRQVTRTGGLGPLPEGFTESDS